MVEITKRGQIIGNANILDLMPVAAFAVKTWQDNTAHLEACNTLRAWLKEHDMVGESHPASDYAKTRFYVLFVYPRESASFVPNGQRAQCFAFFNTLESV
jgi:hypothetical protein